PVHVHGEGVLDARVADVAAEGRRVALVRGRGDRQAGQLGGDVIDDNIRPAGSATHVVVAPKHADDGHIRGGAGGAVFAAQVGGGERGGGGAVGAGVRLSVAPAHLQGEGVQGARVADVAAEGRHVALVQVGGDRQPGQLGGDVIDDNIRAGGGTPGVV